MASLKNLTVTHKEQRNHVHSSLLHSASAVKLTVNYTHIMAETNADYQFTESDIWVIDSRMTAFAADLKTSNWASVDEAPDLQWF